MPEHSYTSRRELEQYAFHPAIAIFAPLLCLIVQAAVPRAFPRFAMVDLPLIAVIFFAVARRSPIAGTITGTLIGLFQDGLTNLPFGVNGISKGVIGYLAASIGFAVDVDNVLNRVLLNFAFSLLQSGLMYLIGRRLLGDQTMQLQPLHELLRALLNTAIAVPVFFVLDRFKLRE